MEKNKKIKVTKDGPYLVTGKVPLNEEEIVPDADGYPLNWKETKKYPPANEYLLCRCGKTKTPPYCDQSHRHVFNGKETAKDIPFDKQAEIINGPGLTLKDNVALCASAKFCDRAAGIWDLTKKSNNQEAKKIAIEEACNCPSGRLVINEKKTKKDIEPKFDQSISLTRDADGVNGPLWVKGEIPVVSAEGKTYEVRNRVTLCRCGRSKNKPFCDGSHYN